MTEQELLDMFFQERIAMLIEIFHQKQSNQSERKYEQILHAEIFIENLPSKEKALIQNHIDFKAIRSGRNLFTRYTLNVHLLCPLFISAVFQAYN